MSNDDSGIIAADEVDTWRGGASFSLRNRIYRLTFQLIWLLLARWTLPRWHGWRRLILRAFGATIAPHAGIYPSARIWSPENLEVGDYAFIGPGVEVYSMGKITLEPYALISQRAHLCAGTHDIEDVNFQLCAAPFRIHARAWGATDAFVGPGVTIGRGAVLGARSVTFRDLDPWTVNVGNPANHIKDRRVRFPDCPE